MTAITTLMMCLSAVAIDGDTLRCASGARFRLVSVAAPERGEPYGQESRATLARLVDGRDLVCVPEGANGNRIVGACWVVGPDVGAEMVRSGLARDCPAYGGRYAELDHNPLDLPRASYCEVSR